MHALVRDKSARVIFSMNTMQGHTVPDYVAIGFEKIDRDLRFLIACLGEVLSDLGHDDLARHLPWSDEAPSGEGGAVPAQLGLVYSIAFQLLNMVEENAAASMRALRESSEGLAAERGLWGGDRGGARESVRRAGAHGASD
jgi:phosphoenolpyruvate carboxylase